MRCEVSSDGTRSLADESTGGTTSFNDAWLIEISLERRRSTTLRRRARADRIPRAGWWGWSCQEMVSGKSRAALSVGTS
jgi:hypothetical protein